MYIEESNKMENHSLHNSKLFKLHINIQNVPQTGSELIRKIKNTDIAVNGENTLMQIDVDAVNSGKLKMAHT